MATKPNLTLDSGQVISGLDPNYDAFAKQQKNYIGATNFANLQKEYTPYQIETATKNIGGHIFWNPDVNIKDIPAQMASTELAGGTGATIPAPEKASPTDVNALMAGINTGTEGTKAILEQINKPLPSQGAKDAVTERIDSFAEENKTGLRDLQEDIWNRFGATENIANLQALMPQMAATQAEFDKYSVGLEGKTASASSIYGRQALAQRQKAVEMAGLGAMAQAYQGNVQLAQSMANDAINAKYRDQEMYLGNLRLQLDAISDDLSREDKARADSLNMVIAERERAIAEEKDREQKIANIMVAVAENGADPATLQSIMNAKTYREAIIKASPFLNIDTTSPEPKKIGTDEDGNDLFWEPLSGSVKTALQLTSFQLGSQVGTIMGLPAYATRAANPGVNRSDRNNNPGNIKVSSYTKEFDGVIGVESDPALDGGNFLIFENPEAGINAIGRLLLEGKPYDNKTAEEAIKTYNGGGSYGARDVLLDPNKDFKSQIQDPAKRFEVAMAIAKAEGYTLPQISEGFTDEVMDWAKNINEGRATLANVPGEKMRSQVSSALQTLEDPTKEARQKNVTEKGAGVLRDLERALDSVNKAGRFSGYFAEQVNDQGIPTLRARLSPAFELQQHIDSVKSNISIEQLQQMREASPTGGALGQVPVRQQQFLMQVLGSLSTSLEPKILRENLNDIYNVYLNAIFGDAQELDDAVAEGRITKQRADEINSLRKPSSLHEIFGQGVVSTDTQTDISDLNFKF